MKIIVFRYQQRLSLHDLSGIMNAAAPDGVLPLWIGVQITKIKSLLPAVSLKSP
jgi:hypothetical protein